MGKGDSHEAADEHLSAGSQVAEDKEPDPEAIPETKNKHDRDWMADVLANRFLMMLYR